MTSRGKVVALANAGVAIAVLVAGLAAWPSLEEEWWLRRLRNGDQDARERAAERLGELGSVRAVPELAAAAQDFVVVGSFSYFDQGSRGRDFITWHGNSQARAFDDALYRIGKPALLPLIRCLGESEGTFGYATYFLLRAIRRIHGGFPEITGPQSPVESYEPVNVLLLLATDEALSADLRQAAVEARQKIQSRFR